MCIREAPIAVDDNLDINEGDGEQFIDVLGNDSDPDDPLNGELTVNEIVDDSGPTFGSASITPGEDGITYTPFPDICNTPENKGKPVLSDSFMYNIRDDADDKLVSNDATVSITINCDRRGPVAEDDNLGVNEGDSGVLLFPLVNDYDRETPLDFGQFITLISYEEIFPFIGTLVNNNDGTFTYTTDDNCAEISGPSYDTQFQYTIEDDDDGLTDTAVFTITVTCERQGPNAVDDTLDVIADENVDPNVAQDIPMGVLNNDIDQDNPLLQDNLCVDRIVSGPSLGTATLQLDADGLARDILYSPNPEFDQLCGTDPDVDTVFDELTYIAIDCEDDNMESNEATVRITIECLRQQGGPIPTEAPPTPWPTKKPRRDDDRRRDDRKRSDDRKKRRKDDDRKKRDDGRKRSKGSKRYGGDNSKSKSSGRKRYGSVDDYRKDNDDRRGRTDTYKDDYKYKSKGSKSGRKYAGSDSKSGSKSKSGRGRYRNKYSSNNQDDGKGGYRNKYSSSKNYNYRAESDQPNVMNDIQTPTTNDSGSNKKNGFGDDYLVYIIIGLITIIFNMIAYVLAYKCCLKRSMIATEASYEHGFVEAKVVDSDCTDEEEEQLRADA